MVWMSISGVDGAFSSPVGASTGCSGFAFPWSVEMFSTRFAGLRGEVRRRMAGREIFALGGYGTAKGDCWDELGRRTKLPWPVRRDGESGDETYGVVDFDGE